MAGPERNQKRSLGRGLSALIPQAGAVPVEGALPVDGRGLARIPIDSIDRFEEQPRRHFDDALLEELAASIRVQGILQPLLVRKEGARHRLIAGERRWRAAKLAGLTEVPALVREVSDVEAFELALVENLQRSDLDPIEEAEGYRRLMEEHGLTQERVSERVGKDRSTVANALRLLGLPEEVKVMLAQGNISMGHARALLGIPKIPEMVGLAERIAEQRLSVRDAERLARESKRPTAKKGARTPERARPEVKSLIEGLQRELGTRVRLQDKGGKGTLELSFYSYEDLDRLVERLKR